MTAAPMQGTYMPQYTPVPPTAVSIEVSLSCSPMRLGKRNLSHAGPYKPRNPQIKALHCCEALSSKLSIQKSVCQLNQTYILLCTCS